MGTRHLRQTRLRCTFSWQTLLDLYSLCSFFDKTMTRSASHVRLNSLRVQIVSTLCSCVQSQTFHTWVTRTLQAQAPSPTPTAEGETSLNCLCLIFLHVYIPPFQPPPLKRPPGLTGRCLARTHCANDSLYISLSRRAWALVFINLLNIFSTYGPNLAP